MKRLILASLFLTTIAIFAGCGNNGNSSEPSTEQVNGDGSANENTEDISGKAIDNLTGLYIDEEAAVRRPVAVVINNIHKALPQSGISQADIIYEVLAEGDITRLIAIYKDFDAEKIGPVRSARHYFTNFALDHDAIFVHHGGSELAYDAIDGLGVDAIDGMTDDSTFWRDPERANEPGMYEHSSYTSAENILRGAEAKGYRMETYEDMDAPFEFYPELTQPSGGLPAEKVTVPFSSTYTSTFTFDPQTNGYKVSQGVEESLRVDDETGGQVEVTNVIVQFTDMYLIPGDDAGRRDVELVGSGDGYLITDGVYVPLTWEKTSDTDPTQWYGPDGGKLTVNKGKTWVCVFNGEVDFHIPEPEESGATES